MNRHGKNDLKQLQSLPLEAKIYMTQERIEAWYQSWTRFEIFNEETGKTRFKTIDTRNYGAEPEIKDSEYIVSAFPGSVYVSFSGGKDSTVLKHIVDDMYSDVPSVFVNTGLEYPEIQQFVRDVKAGKHGCFNSDVEIMRPEMRFDEVIKEYCYPVISKEVSRKVYEANRSAAIHGIDVRETGAYNRKFNPDSAHCKKYPSFCFSKWDKLFDAPFPSSNMCCDVMKKAPVKQFEKDTGRRPVLGTMAEESRLRTNNWIRNGCNAFDAKRPQSAPLSFWTEQDVLHYIKKYDVPYCSVYGDIQVKPHGDDVLNGQIDIVDYLGCYEPEDTLITTGCARTGCMFCMFGCHLEKEPNRFQRMKQTHPKQYAYCMDKLGLKKVLEYIGVPYE